MGMVGVAAQAVAGAWSSPAFAKSSVPLGHSIAVMFMASFSAKEHMFQTNQPVSLALTTRCLHRWGEEQSRP
mgnify:CR=1 FL=1